MISSPGVQDADLPSFTKLLWHKGLSRPVLLWGDSALLPPPVVIKMATTVELHNLCYKLVSLLMCLCTQAAAKLASIVGVKALHPGTADNHNTAHNHHKEPVHNFCGLHAATLPSSQPQLPSPHQPYAAAHSVTAGCHTNATQTTQGPLSDRLARDASNSQQLPQECSYCCLRPANASRHRF